MVSISCKGRLGDTPIQARPMLDGMGEGAWKETGVGIAWSGKSLMRKQGKNSGKKTQKAGSWSGGNKKTHTEEEGFKKQKRGLGILMEWTSASDGGLFMGRGEEV